MAKLTKKRQAFVKELLDNPKQSAAAAAAKVYNTTTTASAASMASYLVKNKDVMAALTEYDNLFKSAIVKTVDDWQDHDSPRQREIALDAAKFGYEAIHGKATVKVESKSTVVNISIDLAPEETKDQPLDITDDLIIDI